VGFFKQIRRGGRMTERKKNKMTASGEKTVGSATTSHKAKGRGRKWQRDKGSGLGRIKRDGDCRQKNNKRRRPGAQ